MCGRGIRTFPAYTILQQTPVNASSVNKTNRLLHLEQILRNHFPIQNIQLLHRAIAYFVHF